MNKFLISFLSLLPTLAFSQKILGDPKAIVYAMDIQPENKLLVAISEKEKVELWNYESQVLLKSWQLDSRGTSVAISNNTIVVTKTNGVVDIYDALTFEKKVSQKLTEHIPLLDVKVVSEQIFFLVDTKGNVYTSDSTQLIFHKLFTTPEPVKLFDFVPAQNAIVTFHSNGQAFLWSLSGTLLSKQQISKHSSLAIKGSAKESKIYASLTSGKVMVYNANPTNFLGKISSFKVSQWAVSLDCDDDLVAIGTTGGLINIYTKMGIYKTRLSVIINSIQILPDRLPQIVLAVGTHGGGIRIIPALSMKLD